MKRVATAVLLSSCVLGGIASAKPPSTILDPGFFGGGPWLSKQELIQGLNAPNGLAGTDANGNVTAPVTGNASAASAQAAYSGSVSRTLSQKWGDRYNLADLGAKLDGSASDAATIQSAYNNLADGAVVEIPRNSSWDGTVNSPDPNKHITWIFDGTLGGYYAPPPGDGDISVQYSGGLNVQEKSVNTGYFRLPANFFFWNQDGKFTGPYSKNYTQNPSAYFKAISGPTSAGNTSAASMELDGYGNGPSSSYDVNLDLYTKKFGQNSTWGIVDDINDFSGKSPGAFASWNEFDLWANGYDVLPWDQSYGTPQAGHRSVFFVSGHHLPVQEGWYSTQAVSVPSATKPGDLPEPFKIAVGAPDGITYIWYPVQSGTTGSTGPSFPSPAKIRGWVANGVLTVTYVASGTISPNDYITGAVPLSPLQITGQVSGTTGGIGTYSVADSSITVGSSTDTGEPMYTAPRVTDGTVVWQFGEEYAQTISSVLWVTGTGDTFDTVVGVDAQTNVSGAVVTSELANMGSTAATVRMASGQKIDMSADGTLAGRNQHTLSYENNALSYKVKGTLVSGVTDNGFPIHNATVVNAAGSTIDTATPALTAVTYVNSTVTGLGVIASAELATANGAEQEIVNLSGNSIQVYPVNGAWSFWGKSGGAPITLPALSSLTMKTFAGTYIYPEYHPAAP